MIAASRSKSRTHAHGPIDMVKFKGLGRGLDALLSGNEEAKSGDVLATLAIDALKAGRYQPRTRMNQAALQELADSIKAQG
jgi:ParB family chromosome partitioning protein